MLVAAKDSRLPDRCVKCNQPRAIYVNAHVDWEDPESDGAQIERVAGMLPRGWGLIGLFLSFSGTRVAIGLCRSHAIQRLTCIALCWAFVCAALLLLLARDLGDDRLLAAIGVLLAAPVPYILSVMVRVDHMTGDRVWLTGVSPDYVGELPALGA